MHPFLWRNNPSSLTFQVPQVLTCEHRDLCASYTLRLQDKCDLGNKWLPWMDLGCYDYHTLIECRVDTVAETNLILFMCACFCVRMACVYRYLGRAEDGVASLELCGFWEPNLFSGRAAFNCWTVSSPDSYSLQISLRAGKMTQLVKKALSCCHASWTEFSPRVHAAGRGGLLSPAHTQTGNHKNGCWKTMSYCKVDKSGWIDGSAVRSTCFFFLLFFSRGPVFGSQHPHSTSQLSVTLISEDLKLVFWPPVGTRYTCAQTVTAGKTLYRSIHFLKWRQDSIRSGLGRRLSR